MKLATRSTLDLIIIALMIILTFAVVFYARSSHAHGDAEWIMKNPQTAKCCGPRDCEKTPEGAVIEKQGGWLIVETGQFFSSDSKGVYASKDADFWWCRMYLSEGEAGPVRCLFVPVDT